MMRNAENVGCNVTDMIKSSTVMLAKNTLVPSLKLLALMMPLRTLMSMMMASRLNIELHTLIAIKLVTIVDSIGLDCLARKGNIVVYPVAFGINVELKIGVDCILFAMCGYRWV